MWLVSLIYRAEAITLMSVDYGAALSSPGLLWSTRRLDTSTSLGRHTGGGEAHLHRKSSTKGLQSELRVA